MRAAIHAVIAYLLEAIERGDRDCPYRCERHRDAWLRRVPPRGF